jgi:PAS domain S-box-containing protein
MPQAIAAVYVAIGGLWILLSEILLRALVGDSGARGYLGLLAGWLFVGATGAFLYGALRRFAATEMASATTMETFFEAAVRGIVISGPDGRIERVNRSAEAMFGYTRAELIGRSIDLVLPADDASGAGIQLPPREGEAADRLVGCRKDGTQFLAEVSQSAVGTGGTERVMSFVTDVSARSRGEEAVARLAAIVESSQDAILSKTLDGIVLTWNANASTGTPSRRSSDDRSRSSSRPSSPTSWTGSSRRSGGTSASSTTRRSG